MNPTVLEREVPAPGGARPPVLRPKRRAFRRWMWLAGIALLGFALAGMLIPWLASRQLQKITGRSFHFGFLLIAPNGHVSISLQGAQDLNRQIYLDAGRARFDWWSLLLKRMRVGYVELRDARFEIERTDAGELIVNSVNVTRLSQAEPAPVPAPAPAARGSQWGLGIGGVRLSNLRIDYKEGGLRVNLAIDRFVVGPAESWRAERETPFEAELTLNGGKIFLKGAATPFSPSIRLDSKISVAALPLEWIGPLLKSARIREVKGFLNVDGRLKSEYQKKNRSAEAVWSGDVALKNTSALYEKFRMSADGSVSMAKVQVRRAGPDLSYSAETIQSAGPLSLELRDESFRRAPRFKLSPLEFKISGVDSLKPDQRTSVDVKAALGKYDRLTLSGWLTPFAKSMNGALSAKVKDFDLAPFTAYAEKYAGSRIQTGVFNLDTKAAIRDDQLDAKNEVLLRKLEFQYINKQMEEEGTRKVGLPINVFLSLLKDKNGDIALDVPMNGPVRDPSVGAGPLIAKLAMKAAAYAAKKAAVAFFPPLKTVELAGSVAAFAMKWRFEPVAFLPGKPEPTGESENYLEEVGKRLRDRPGVRLTVCGYGTRLDLPPAKAKEEPPPLSLKEKDLLLKLAADRAAFIKDFLVGRYGIDPSRLILCSPNLEDSAGALPRGTLSL